MPAHPASLSLPRLYSDRGTQWSCTLLALVLLLGIAWLDYATGYEISVFVAYLFPIFLVTWALGRAAGAIVSGLAVALWTFTFAFPHVASPFAFAWEAGLQLTVYLVFVAVLDRLKSAIVHADERFVAVLENLDALVYVLRPRDGRVLYVNQKCREAFGAAPRQSREIEARFGAPLPGASAGAAGALPLEVQDRLTGRWHWLAVQDIRWVDGKPVQLHIASDITARKEAEDAARQQRERMEASQRLITAGEMASLLAHELNQPLAAIANYNTGCVNRLRSGNWQPEGLLEALEKSALQARRAGGIIQRVREFLRKREPDLAACELHALVAETAAMAEDDARLHGVLVRLEPAPALPHASADPILIRQAVLNLIRNGIEAMLETPAGDRELVLRVRAASCDQLQVTVEDRGCGLPAEMATDPFRPFFTTKSHGIGMGLQISRSIVEMHGGKLWAEALAAGGTAFHFTVPAAVR